MKEDYGRIDTALVELRGADALGSEKSDDGRPKDDEEEQEEQFRRDVIATMS